MNNENRFDAVHDIFSIPCAMKINGEKAIKICGNFAYVQFADGMKTYYKRNEFSKWECIRTEVCTNA